MLNIRVLAAGAIGGQLFAAGRSHPGLSLSETPSAPPGLPQRSKTSPGT